MTHQADQRPSRPLVLRRGLTRTATLAAALMLVSAGLAPPVRADVPAAPRPLLLKVTAPEPVLRGGVVVPGQVTRTYSLTLDAGERRLLRARQPSREQPSRDLNALLKKHRRGEDTSADFQEFLALHGDYFPENPQSVEELIDALAIYQCLCDKVDDMDSAAYTVVALIFAR